MAKIVVERKFLYVYNEGLGSANKRTSKTLPIEWKKTSGIEILKAIEFYGTAGDKVIEAMNESLQNKAGV